MNSLDGWKILVVEDIDTCRKLLVRLLTAKKAEVFEAENGEQALQVVEKNELSAVLMDIQMPVMDGYTATQILRERGFSPPIIAVTAASAAEGETMLEKGFTAYCPKPVLMDKLIGTLGQVSGA